MKDKFIGREKVMYRKSCFIRNGLLYIERHKRICAINQDGTTVVLSDTILKTKNYKLIESTPEDIRVLRESHEPLFVMRTEGKYYYCFIPASLSLLSSKLLGEHICASDTKICKHLNYVQFDLDGCCKLGHVLHLEDMPEILESYETFGCDNDAWVVSKCNRCEY